MSILKSIPEKETTERQFGVVRKTRARMSNGKKQSKKERKKDWERKRFYVHEKGLLYLAFYLQNNYYHQHYPCVNFTFAK